MKQTSDTTNKFLSEDYALLLVEVLDCIVPRDGDIPGAGEVGVAVYIGGEMDYSKYLKALIEEVLISIEETSQEMYSQCFGILPDRSKVDVLSRVESENGEFFKELVRLCYSGYYIDPEIRQFLGLEQRPPFPVGYDMEPLDMSLLENVKSRGRIYRDVK